MTFFQVDEGHFVNLDTIKEFECDHEGMWRAFLKNGDKHRTRRRDSRGCTSAAPAEVEAGASTAGAMVAIEVAVLTLWKVRFSAENRMSIRTRGTKNMCDSNRVIEIVYCSVRQV